MACLLSQSSTGNLFLEATRGSARVLTVLELLELPPLSLSSRTMKNIHPARAGLILVAVYSLVFGSEAQPSSSPTHAYNPEIGSYRQLFIEDYRIDSIHELERLMHPGSKMEEPVLVPTEPWERDAVYLYGTVLFDEEERIFKMWYQTFWKKPYVCYILYATSKDGIKWKKPSLGVFEWEGSTENNIVLHAELGTVVKDMEEKDPHRRYKMLCFVRPGYRAFFSPDGVRWTQSKTIPVIPNGDVGNVTFDPRTKQFVAMTKQPHPGGRTVFVSYSKDFERWSPPKPVFAADAMDNLLSQSQGGKRMEVYGMTTAPYEDIYLGFPWLFNVTKMGRNEVGDDGPINVQLAVSRDWETWQRPIRKPILSTGILGSVDDGMIFTSSNLIEHKGSLWMYYGQWDNFHLTFDRKASIGLATWRKDGFVSLSNGGDKPGNVTTKPVRIDGTSLRVNAVLNKPGGYLRAEVLDEDGTVLPGFSFEDSVPLRGMSVERRLKWIGGNNFADLKGRTVRLRFHLRDGDFYSYHVR